MKKRCTECFFSLELTAQDTGQIQANGEQALICRRNPPTPIPIPQQGLDGRVVLSIQAVHPPVRRDDYCGEFISMNPGIATN